MNPFASLIEPPRDLPCRDYAPPAPPRPPRPPAPRRTQTPNPWGLSSLQCEVVRRLGTHSLDAIGRELGIATKTASNNVRFARDKMQAHSRNHAALMWAAHFGEATHV